MGDWQDPEPDEFERDLDRLVRKARKAVGELGARLGRARGEPDGNGVDSRSDNGWRRDSSGEGEQ